MGQKEGALPRAHGLPCSSHTNTLWLEHTPACTPPGHSQAQLLPMSASPWVSLWELLGSQERLEASVLGTCSVDISTRPVYLQGRRVLETSRLQLGLGRERPD